MNIKRIAVNTLSRLKLHSPYYYSLGQLPRAVNLVRSGLYINGRTVRSFEIERRAHKKHYDVTNDPLFQGEGIIPNVSHIFVQKGASQKDIVSASRLITRAKNFDEILAKREILTEKGVRLDIDPLDEEIADQIREMTLNGRTGIRKILRSMKKVLEQGFGRSVVSIYYCSFEYNRNQRQQVYGTITNTSYFRSGLFGEAYRNQPLVYIDRKLFEGMIKHSINACFNAARFFKYRLYKDIFIVEMGTIMKTKSFVIIPIWSNGRLIGKVNIGLGEKKQLDPYILEKLEKIAGQLNRVEGNAEENEKTYGESKIADFVRNRKKAKGLFWFLVAAKLSSELINCANELIKILEESFELLFSFGKHFSPDVVKEIERREYEIELGGEEKEVTMLFTDIRDFTGLSEKMSPNETITFVNDYFGKVVPSITGNGGMIDKYVGDAVMALFGAPFHADDDAKRAVMAALEIQRKLKRLNDQKRKAGLLPVRMGIGINTGNVIAGRVGTDEKMEYTVIGDSVNVASRIEGLTKECNKDEDKVPLDCPVLISQSTYDKIKDKTIFRVIKGPMYKDVKGKAQKVRVYLIGGKKD